MAEVVFYGGEPCIICGQQAVIDIDHCQYPHRCSDGVMRWTDGSVVKELASQSLTNKKDK